MKKDMLLNKFKCLKKQLCINLVFVTFCICMFKVQANASDTYITDEELSTLYELRKDEKKDTCLTFTVEEAEMLMKIAYHEDHTDIMSQAYIMSEVMNRVKSPDFPNTIKEVLNQKNQFLRTDSSEFKNVLPDTNSHYALYLLESGQIQTDFLFHEAIGVESSWQSRNREVSKEYGGTRFYR